MIVLFSKLFSAFILPPGVFILIFIGIALLIFPFLSGRVQGVRIPGTSRFRWAFRFSLAGALMLYLVSIEPVADFLLLPLENRYPALVVSVTTRDHARSQVETLAPARTVGIDTIVVLGGGTVAGSPELGTDSLRTESTKRLLHGHRIYREKNQASIIVSGGRVFPRGQKSEAEVMAKYLIEWGVPEEDVRLEPESRNTWQNAQNVSKKYAVTDIILVTSAYHMPRAVWSFQQAGVRVIPAPTDYKVHRTIPYDLESFLPTLGAFENSRRALHEYLGLLFYKLMYG